MRIRDTKLPHGIKNWSVLIQQCVFNVCRVIIMVQSRMKDKRKIINNIYFIYSIMCVLRGIDYISQLRNWNKCYLNIFNFEETGLLVFVQYSMDLYLKSFLRYRTHFAQRDTTIALSRWESSKVNVYNNKQLVLLPLAIILLYLLRLYFSYNYSSHFISIFNFRVILTKWAVLSWA